MPNLVFFGVADHESGVRLTKFKMADYIFKNPPIFLKIGIWVFCDCWSRIRGRNYKIQDGGSEMENKILKNQPTLRKFVFWGIWQIHRCKCFFWLAFDVSPPSGRHIGVATLEPPLWILNLTENFLKAFFHSKFFISQTSRSVNPNFGYADDPVNVKRRIYTLYNVDRLTILQARHFRKRI